MNDLSRRTRLQECVADIVNGLSTAAIRFVEIHEDKLYLETHKTFDAFCTEVLGMSRQHVYSLMEAEKIKASLPKAIAAKITNSAQAHALAEIPENRRAEVVKSLAENGKITAANIRKSSEILSEKSDTDHPVKMGKSDISTSKNGTPVPVKKVVIVDEVGTPIPEDALPIWNRRQEVQDMMTKVSDFRTVFRKAKEADDPLWASISNSVISDLDAIYFQFSQAKPYAVCTQCMGSPSSQPTGCYNCKNTGMISKLSWDTKSRKEIKEMRLKANALRK